MKKHKKHIFYWTSNLINRSIISASYSYSKHSGKQEWVSLFVFWNCFILQAITESCEALMTKYRRLFCRGLEHHNKQGRLAKASAWYIVSFPKSGQRFPNRPFLSFGWVMEGVLCEIKQCQKFEEIGNSKPLEREVGDSILSYFTNDQAPGTFWVRETIL